MKRENLSETDTRWTRYFSARKTRCAMRRFLTIRRKLHNNLIYKIYAS